MISLALSAHIRAARTRVWGALTEPEQLIHWRPGAERLLDDATGALAVGDALRFRCRVRDVALHVEERVLEARSPHRLRSRVRFGLFRCEVLYSLARASLEGDRTRVSLRLATASETPLLGGSLDRFAVRRFATQLAASHLDALRDWCEGHPPARDAGAAPEVVATPARV